MSSQFQSFEDPTPTPQGEASPSATRLAVLRRQLAQRGLSGLIIPRADEHQGEYVPACEERLAWLTGFTGSAGTALVLEDGAAVIVDGRYVIQVREQIDTSQFAPVALAETSSDQWLTQHLSPNAKFAYDPWLHTDAQVKRLEEAVSKVGGSLVALDANPVDAIWEDRPAAPHAPIYLHPLSVAGEPVSSKIERVRALLQKANIDGLIISDPHNIAWLFNIRGNDVPHTPIALGYALVPVIGRPTLCFDRARFDEVALSALTGIAKLPEDSTLTPRKALEDAIATLANRAEHARIRIDQDTGAFALQDLVTAVDASFDIGPDPVTAFKAVKNLREIEGTRAAHRRDGAAVTRFLAWVAQEAPKGNLTEIDVVVALEKFRVETGLLKDISFTTIAGANENAALPHYRVTNASNRPVLPGILLVDSGGQYVDGTTDITRTIAIGTPTDEMRDRFTRVLKGHIAVARTVFPEGTTGAQIDPFARHALWEAGLDFDHGTGHGVGSYLSVHEGPQRISKISNVALKAGMILSNEPGYYCEGHYGIRIENLLIVEHRIVEGAERSMLGFETITLVPIDRALIEISLLRNDEIEWLNAYHARVYDVIAPQVNEATRIWLSAATEPLRALSN